MSKLTFLALFTLTSFSVSLAQSVNAIGLRQGARIISSPPSHVAAEERNQLAKYSPGALFDDTYNVWCSKNVQFPFVFVCEFTEEFEINELRFNNSCENYEGIETKDVKVEFSTVSAESGFRNSKSYSLEKGKMNDFKINNVKARWVKLTILSNYGHAKWVELAEFEVVGKHNKPLGEEIDINGAWKTNWQNITFKQTGKNFTGSYAYDNVKGTVTKGRVSRNMIFFQWQEGALTGSASLYMNAEGDQLSGLWINKNKASDYGLWTMKRDIPKPINFLEEVDEGKSETLDFNGQEVKLGEKVVLNNILFVKSKAVLLPESLPELNDLIELLNENQRLNIFLAGHTDNTGNDQKNIELSEQRVDAVKRYMIKNGISDTRIDGKGFGPFQPLNENRNAEEKKQNRRVEFTLQE